MNIRSLTRGDGAVIGAAVLLLVTSFLPFFSFDECDSAKEDCTVSAWSTAVFPVLPSVHLLGLLAAALVVAARFLPTGRKVMGLELGQWGVSLSVFAAWSALWSLFSELWYEPDAQEAAAQLPEGVVSPFETLNEKTALGYGAFLTAVFAVALAALAVAGGKVPALRGALLPAPRPQAQPHPAAGAAAGAGHAGGYGYPGTGGAAAYGGRQPDGHQQGGPQQGVPSQGGHPEAGAPGHAPEFAPFWFAVPVNRPLYGEDGSPSPVAELTPGVWYLAVDQRGQSLVAQTQDGRRGVLQDTTGIQRG
ncbi:hypothetical protein ACFV1B_12270 [Streptomyces sp. NPDC059637]|uniref:hypothetical protein n=1 Tax=Streptomyces sp. NPDC059637 TaxID=3347752 RepID=UPI0036858A4F